jgi:hypothetical protein
MFGFKKKQKDAEGVEFLKFCERNFGAKVGSIHVLPSSNRALPDISMFIWHDCPEPGVMTVISYGLSLMRKPEWVRGRPELMLRLETKDEAWGFAVAAFIDMFREEKTFTYQTILTTDNPVVPGTEMRGFFTFGPPVAKPEEMTFASAEGLPINLTGFYPIYLEERELLPRIGLEAFWHHEQFDFLNATRPNLAKITID